MLEKTTRVNLLYDFYCNLLTQKQRAIIELYFHQDLSLGEIAGEMDISRQAVHDLVKRTVNSLERYEEKLQLWQKYQVQEELCKDILRCLEEEKQLTGSRIRRFIGEIRQL